MKIIISPDSFKGSITAKEFCSIVKDEISKSSDAQVVSMPIADGGEGTLDNIVPEGNIIHAECTDLNFEKMDGFYGYIGSNALIEMAIPAGITLNDYADRSAGRTTTYGVGELIADAVKRGFEEITLFVGGSGTNDGGAGMMAALGAEFYDSEGKEFVPTGFTLSEIARIDMSGMNKALKGVKVNVATDVKNVLYGSDGATYIYGRQKGATDEELDVIERGMKHFGSLLEAKAGKSVGSAEGLGAGGGIAAPLYAFYDARIISGIDKILHLLNFDEEIKDASFIITGEGKIDYQSLCGKAISGVCRSAEKYEIPVYCIVGMIGDDKAKLLGMGIKDIYALTEAEPNVGKCIREGKEVLKKVAQKFINEVILKSE